MRRPAVARGSRVCAMCTISSVRFAMRLCGSQTLVVLPSHGAFGRRSRGNAHKVDAVSIPGVVGKVVSQVGPIGAHGLSVAQDSYVLLNHFLVAEGWPAMSFGLGDEFRPGATAWSDERRLPGHAIVECDLGCVSFLLLDCFQERSPVA